jgi:endonuclease/exonuclease/phosphatase family metal-dependent hydrolase
MHKLGGRTACRSIASALLTVAVLLSALTVRSGAADFGDKRAFQTMTVNLYIGSGTERILALDPADPDYPTKLVAAVTGVYYEIVASQPQVRIGRVADEIVTRMPDVVAVEEATLLRNQSPGDLAIGGVTPATNVVFDYLQMLTDALAERGVHYAVAANSEEWDIEMPMMNMQTGVLEDIRQTDRDAILVRTDLPRGQLRVSHPRNGSFTNLLEFPSLGFSVKRGWCSVNVFVRGQVFRYICAHLEEETVPTIQALQAQELLADPARTALPVIIAGDFNCDALHRDGSFAYDLFPLAGFQDAWAKLYANDASGGLTFGHDEFLADPTHAFDRRIDFVLFRGIGLMPVSAEIAYMGLDRDENPLWASDHAALVTEFQIKRVPLAHR